MHAARALRQRNVNHTRWNVILIVALEDKQERREGCFAADLAVNVFSTTIPGLVKLLNLVSLPTVYCLTTICSQKLGYILRRTVYIC